MKLKFRILTIPSKTSRVFKPGTDNIPMLNVPEQSIWFLWNKLSLNKDTIPYSFQYTLKKIG